MSLARCSSSLSLKSVATRSISSRKTYATTADGLSSGTREEYDVVIVGGGPAGLALAAGLAASKPIRGTTSIALIEAGDLSKIRSWSQPEDTFSNRVSSITNASQSFLEGIGAWSHVDTSRVAKLEDMQVWDGLSDARIQFASSSLPGPRQMAHMTENLNIQRGLLRLLKEYGDSVRLLDNVKVESITPDVEGGRWPIVRLSSGTELRARLLVGADGFNSPVKKYAKIGTHGWAYDTHAVVATMFHSPSYPGTPKTAYQRFLPTGPIAFLPLSSSTASSLVWSTKPHLASALKAAHPGVLKSMINAAFRLPDISMRILNDLLLSSPPVTPEALEETIRWRENSHGIAPLSSMSSIGGDGNGGMAAVGGYGEDDLPPLVHSIQPGSVAGFPLRLSHAEAYIGDESQGEARTALVGDAAHTVHPLAGQGLNMGLGDVQALVQTIESAVLAGGDIGSRTALLSYPRARYFENHKLLSATDKLHKLYSVTWPPAVWARSVGLEVINELESVKGVLMANAGSSTSTNPSPLWDMGATGVESLTGVVRSGTMVLKSAADVAGNLLRGAIQRR